VRIEGDDGQTLGTVDMGLEEATSLANEIQVLVKKAKSAA
jgi:hypothetical protein